MKPSLSCALRNLAAVHLEALALVDGERPAVGWPLCAGVLLIHIVGLAAFWRYYHQPVWLALPTLALLLLFPALAYRSHKRLAVETLAPLFFLYAILIGRVIAVRVLLAQEPYQDEASFADPRFVFFQVEGTVAAVIGYLALVQSFRLTRETTRTRALVALAVVLGIGALGWFGLEAIGHRTSGVTATDPYVYAQMAVDMASRASPLHQFPLFPFLAGTKLSWYPIEHIGYRLFDNLSGTTPSVWPAGGSLLLALAYRLIGEEGLYLLTPIVSLLSLIALAMLVWEYLSSSSLVVRTAVAAIAVALLATSWEQVDRSIVPLVDTTAQLFTVIAIWAALRAAHAKRIIISGAVAGAALGAAYFVRHTQVLLVVPILVAAWPLLGSRRWTFLASAALAASIVALPDLWYHHEYLGGWLTPESHELALFALSNVTASASVLAERFLVGIEFGYIWPFLVYGSYRAAREGTKKFLVISIWIVLLTGFHLLYAAVKLRDLLPEYPAVILLAAYGMFALVRDVRGWIERHGAQGIDGIGWLGLLRSRLAHVPRADHLVTLSASRRSLSGVEDPRNKVEGAEGTKGLEGAQASKRYDMRLSRISEEGSRQSPHEMLRGACPEPGRRAQHDNQRDSAWLQIFWPRALTSLVLFAALLLPAMRDRITILRPFEPVRVTFGYVTTAQRASFDRIAALTPAGAVIGSTMNDGPIDLYEGRATFRPGAFTTAERFAFVDMMQKAGRPVYVLNDGSETSAALEDFSTRYAVQEIAAFDVPLFGNVEGAPGGLWKIGPGLAK